MVMIVLLSEILMKSASLTGQQVRSVVLSANPGGVSLEILRSLAKSFPSREEVSLPSPPPPCFFSSRLIAIGGVFLFPVWLNFLSSCDPLHR
jgi:hypothetical protein